MDRIDFEIVECLQNNARISNKELAREIGLAPSSCLERVRRLQREGTLRGYHADVDPGRLGIKLEAMVAVRLDHHSREAFEGFKNHVLKRSEVISIYQLGGANDFLIHAAVRNAEHLRDLTLDGIASREEVAHLETSIIFSHDRSWTLPNFEGEGAVGTR